MTAKRTLKSRDTLKALERAAMQWYRSYCVGLDLHKMNAPAYPCGATLQANHALLKACARHAQSQAGGKRRKCG